MFEKYKLDPLGVAVDIDPHDTPDEIYTDLENMRFSDNAMEKFGGETESSTTTEQATHLLFNGDRETPAWIYAGDGLVRHTDFTTDTDLSNVAVVSSGTNWDSALFNGFPILNNTVDAPWYWDGNIANDVAALTAFPASTTCQAIRPYRSFLVALNVTDAGGTDENRILWSDASDAGAIPASWDITDPTTLAGDAYLTDSTGEVVDGSQLRDYFAIYKTHSIYLMRFTGSNSVMKIDKVQVNSGVLAKNCIAEFKGRHFVGADGDIILFDGQNVQSIADKRVRRTIFSAIDSTNYKNCFVARYDQKDEMWFCYPESGAANVTRAAVWNWKDDKWSFRELPDTRHLASGLTNMVGLSTWDSYTTTTWDSFTSRWTASSNNPTADALASAATLAINTMDETNDSDGTLLTSKLEKTTMDLGDPDHMKFISSVTPRITADNGTVIQIRIGTQNNPYDTISWGTEKTYTVGTDREVYFDQIGRFISIRMRTSDLNTTWKCHGFFFKGKLGGKV